MKVILGKCGPVQVGVCRGDRTGERQVKGPEAPAYVVLVLRVDAMKACGEKYRDTVRKGFSNRLDAGVPGMKSTFEQ